jgi:hypothetical membrane protein
MLFSVAHRARLPGVHRPWRAWEPAVMPCERACVPAFALVSAGSSPMLLIGGWTVSGALQPSGYSPVHQTVSVLAGQGAHDGWLMTRALVGVGVCQLVAAVALRVLTGGARVCLAVAGLLGIGIALSPEPSGGTATRHVAFAAVGAVVIAVWPALVGRRVWRHSAVLSVRGSAIAAAAFLVLLAWFVAEATLRGSQLGTAERVATAVQVCWPFVVAVAARRAQPVPGPRAPVGQAGSVQNRVHLYRSRTGGELAR